MEMAYLQQALIVFKRRGDHRQFAAESRIAGFRTFRSFFSDSEVPRVVVATPGSESCFECQKLEEAIYGIDRALESMPIPYGCCKTWADKNPYGGWFRCYYQED